MKVDFVNAAVDVSQNRGYVFFNVHVVVSGGLSSRKTLVCVAELQFNSSQFNSVLFI